MCACFGIFKRQQSYKYFLKQTICQIRKNKKFSKIFSILLVVSVLIFIVCEKFSKTKSCVNVVYGYVSCLCCGLQVVRGCVWFQLVCLLFCPFGSSDTACRVPTDCDAKLQYFATALAVFCCLIRFLRFNVVYSPFLIPHSKHPFSLCIPCPYPTATFKQTASKKTTVNNTHSQCVF